VPTEELVFLAFGAIGAFQAAYEKNCHPKCDQYGQHARVRTDQLSKGVHMARRTATRSVLSFPQKDSVKRF